MRTKNQRKQRTALALLLALLLAAVLPFASQAQEAEGKVVRVGWFDSSFCRWDQFGRRGGIDYKYQQKISAYTGWTYEYVEDSWPNLLQKLIAGEIDLLSDVSWREDRTELMLFPDLPMGTESYYIFIDAENREITADNLSSFNGRRIGVNQGSVQETFLREWAEKNSLSIEIVPLVTEEEDSMRMVRRGTLDGYASIYTYSSEYEAIPVCRIGASDYYYAVNKNRPDLLAELNMALSGIRDEDPYFAEQISQERLFDSKTNVILTPTQEDWLKNHDSIRIGYLEDFYPFCAKDKETGMLTGALQDLLAHTEKHIGNNQIRFEAVPYATTAAALEALKAGEVDCVYPVYLNDYDAEQKGVRLTNPAMKTGMNAVMRDTETLTLSREANLTFVVDAGNPNEETFIMEQYPASRILTFPDEKACYEAVSSGLADCLLISNYRLTGAEESLERYKLFSVPTGEHVPFSFAVNRADRDLYFLLNKAVILLQSGEMDSALASHMHTTRKMTFSEFIRDNWYWVFGVLTVLFAVIVFLLLQRMRAQRKANEQQRLLEEAQEVAELKQTITSLLDNMPGISFTKDAESGVYLACNQAFAEYARKKKPEDVIGHTAAELFDAETAKRLTEDDRMALSMDEPYIFFEDATGSDGSRRQIKTTKLKYTDAAGRLCVLGIFEDITNSYRIRRGSAATNTKESYEKAKGAGFIYSHIAQALARGYEELYYVDLNTEEFIEYRTDAESGGLSEVRRGWHFFEQCLEEIDQKVWAEDRDAVKKALDRKTLTAELDRNNTFMIAYRLNGEQDPVYVNMRVTRMQDDDRFIVLGITNIDEQVKQRNAAARMQEEQIAYNRLRALAGEFLCVYITDPETGHYREFNAATGYQDFFAQAPEGTDFFTTTREAIRQFIHPEDLQRFLSGFTRDNVLADIGRCGMFTLSYRLMINEKPRYVQLKAVMVEEKEGSRLIFGINDIDSQVRQEENYVDHLAQARIQASVDPLTGVKNRHAYLMAEERLNLRIAENPAEEFAVVILDINDLKTVNDRDGHNAGDQYIKDACRIICKTFNHSPVFRVGGDEFVVISQGEDYTCMDDLLRQMNDRNTEALRSGGVVIACGMARRENDSAVAPVFERADQQMYENKSALKQQQNENR